MRRFIYFRSRNTLPISFYNCYYVMQHFATTYTPQLNTLHPPSSISKYISLQRHFCDSNTTWMCFNTDRPSSFIVSQNNMLSNKHRELTHPSDKHVLWRSFASLAFCGKRSIRWHLVFANYMHTWFNMIPCRGRWTVLCLVVDVWKLEPILNLIPCEGP